MNEEKTKNGIKCRGEWSGKMKMKWKKNKMMIEIVQKGSLWLTVLILETSQELDEAVKFD